MEWERVITHSVMAIMGALATLGGALFVFLRKGKESEIAAGADIRDELRKELRAAREALHEVRHELDEMKDERLRLKRGLDIRDHRIEMLEARVGELEGRSEPEVVE